MLRFHFYHLSFISFLSLFSFKAYASADNKIKDFFSEFEKNSVAVMNKIPEKQIIQNQDEIFKFSQDEITNRSFLQKKDLLRTKLLESSNQLKYKSKAEYLSHDDFRSLLDNPNEYIDNLNTIDRHSPKLNKAELPFQPWSGGYWPFYLGNIAYRYADRNMQNYNNYNSVMSYLTYIQPASLLLQQNRIDELSPSEKYDLLMNDYSFTLTNTILNNLNNKNQKRPIQYWEGICDGWAVSSYLYKRPVRTVKVFNSAGVPINFYPSDLKALNSLLWAKLDSNYKIVGGRCNDENPATDANGRLIAQECFESNPGTVHLALVNQVGINQKSFVFDASYDYMVWNHPVLSYEYRYFNLITKNVYQNSKDAKIPLRQYTSDPFSSYRSHKTIDVVGVELTLVYMVETAPTTARQDSEKKDAIRSVTYYYDLELDRNGRVIGGEWYQNAHPDFLWTPTSWTDVSLNALANERTLWAYNYQNFIWIDNPRSPSPEWTYYSTLYANQYAVPLDNVIKSLTAWASVKSSQIPENCTQPCIPMEYNWHR